MGAAAVPIATSLVGSAMAPAVGTALGSALGTTIPAWLSSAGTGALMGGLGSYLMGNDPLQGMLLGGIGGGIAPTVTDTFGGLFGGGLNPSTEVISPALAAADPSLAASGAGQVAGQAATGGIGSKIVDFLPYAGLAGGAMLLDKTMAPDDVGPPLRSEPENRNISLLEREQMSVDPQDYLTSGGNRNFYAPYSMQPQYFSQGGKARDAFDLAESRGDPQPRLIRIFGKELNTLSDEERGNALSYMKSNKKWSDDDVREMSTNPSGRIKNKYANGGIARGYMNGGSSQASSQNIPVSGGLGRKVKGRGDGRSDDIPAMLSDGEFVISAPVVSALGNGSNDAGARKLDKLQKKVLKKHYKGGKPTKAFGLGGYVH